MRSAGRSRAKTGLGVLSETKERIEERFEMRLAYKCGAVTLEPQHLRDRGCVEGKRDSVHPHAVSGRVLPGQHGRA
jgi:hypothetical protein